MTTSHLPQNKPLYEQVVQLVESDIINGVYGVGDQLPTESEMAAKYQVSRTVVREAMKALKEKGWVQTFVGKGTFVIDDVARGIDSSLDLTLRKDSGRSFEYLIELREILEPEIAALTALHASDEQLARIRKSVDAMDQALAILDYESFLEGDLAFHVGIAEATGNPLILMFLRPVLKLMRAQQEYHLINVSTGGQKSQKNHQSIMAALEKHDVAAASKRMHEHILQVRTDVNTVYEEAKQVASIHLPGTTG